MSRFHLCSCTIKSFRGNVEAQFARSARVQLLYRRDRYFNTREVRLKDFYPMIEWYKQHRHEFLVDGAAPTTRKLKAEHEQSAQTFTSFRDASENTIVALRCHVRGEAPSSRPDATVGSRSTHTPSTTGSDFEGLLLREVIVEDDNGERMVLNLWDQFAELRFVERLVAFRGIVEINRVIISFNAVSEQLLANTTPQTEFRFHDTPAQITPTLLAAPASGNSSNHVRRVASIDAVEESPVPGSVILEGVTVEEISFDRFLGDLTQVTPAFAPLLVECVCVVCETRIAAARCCDRSAALQAVSAPVQT
ncbi:hypothetical protein PINS_up003584 [Pythium insidiosum]|nr:hypothetical protein PINS_up003584 [Pythium insidiosum]